MFPPSLLLVGSCDEGELLLNNTNGLTDGDLMVCESGEFVGICSSGFNMQESRAACRQLGFVDGSECGKWLLQNTSVFARC